MKNRTMEKISQLAACFSVSAANSDRRVCGGMDQRNRYFCR